MADSSGSKDRSLEALDFILNVLKEHEQNLDKSIHEFSKVVEHMGGSSSSQVELGKIEEKLESLQKDVLRLTGHLSNVSKASPPAMIKQPEPITKGAPAISPTITQGMTAVTLDCKQWKDFQILAMHAQTISFGYKEDSKVFQAEAFKGNNIITYTGALPNFSLILRSWLSHQLATLEQNIFEGAINKTK